MGNLLGPLWVPIQKKTPGQATASPVTLPLKNVRVWGQRGWWLRPSWNCTQEKFISPYFTVGAILGTVLEIIDYVNFLGSNRKSS